MLVESSISQLHSPCGAEFQVKLPEHSAPLGPLFCQEIYYLFNVMLPLVRMSFV